MVQETIDVEVHDAKGCSHGTEYELVIDDSNSSLSYVMRLLAVLTLGA